MAQSIRGRRAANLQQTYSSAPASVSFGGEVKRATVLPDGEYDGTVKGVRFVSSRRGAISVVVNFETDDGEAIRIQPMLVSSQAGDSELVVENRAILADMAGLAGEEVNSDELTKRLTGARCWIYVREAADRDGRPINRIDDGGAS